MKVEPIKPEEIVSKKKETIPKEVIQSFNELIAERWNGSYSKVLQKDVVARICSKMKFANRQEGTIIEGMFKSEWLDIEDIYREYGWKVDYDKPAYNETYEASFEFSK